MAVFEIIDSNGYTESVDFFYVPMDLQSKQNKGYAFINFVDAKIAAEFKERFDGARFGDRIDVYLTQGGRSGVGDYPNVSAISKPIFANEVVFRNIFLIYIEP